MSYQNSNPASDSDPSVSSGFSAQSQMGLPDVLQMCCSSRRSGQITFRSGESYGFIFIQHGKVLHAMCGTIEGEEAVYTMLTWPGGGFSLDEDILPHKKTVTLTWEQLLFEGARRADEGTTSNAMPAGVPVRTAEPAISTRNQESQPKLLIARPDLPAAIMELSQEYTHLGRVPGNEICLPYPSISSRHCIFVISGPDVVIRDLNSSNGTIVNGESVSEAVLRPGDTVQVGVVQIKFEAGIKRPKLQAPSGGLRKSTEPMIKPSIMQDLSQSNATVRLPNARTRSAEVKDDSAFVKGAAAISYDTLAKPTTPQSKKPWLIAYGLLGLVAIGAVIYLLFFLRH